MFYTAAPELHEAFSPAHLDCYDHLIGGSYLGAMNPDLSTLVEVAARAHEAAKRGDLAPLPSIWREQDAHFQSFQPHDLARSAGGASRGSAPLAGAGAAPTWRHSGKV